MGAVQEASKWKNNRCLGMNTIRPDHSKGSRWTVLGAMECMEWIPGILNIP
jgi:hypothetical protein